MMVEMPDLTLFVPPTAMLHLAITVETLPPLRPFYVVTPYLIQAGRITRLKHSWTRPTLEGARAVIPPTMTRIARSPEDHPTIVETWI